ncbi:RloB family protein [Chitinophaga filiformis]|uniref:RloB family protein n=1 Tax=Chitinophaga filiformis TaxID=104663 RepID=UPI001F375736|nr:RloB family protein [Chitinophaga filiformis]MCF6404881.1 RloB family protein [Chitinophaga filiformis]
MAKNKSKEQNSFNKMLADLKASKPTVPVVGTKADRKYYLIVSQGTETEILYFKFLATLLPPRTVIVETKGHSKEPKAVVNKAIEPKERRRKDRSIPDYHEVWAVFDKDDFTDRDYNDAIRHAAKEGIESGHSNESFELWYVLHFADLEAALGRKVYIERLSKVLNAAYEKNLASIAETIHTKGDVKRAIQRGKALEALHTGKSAAASTPYTRIYVLVDRLMSHLDNR